VNVVFSDPLPAGTTFVSLYVSAAGWETSTPAAGQAGTVTSRIGALSSDADVVFILVVRVDTSVPGGSLIPNTATISSSTTDPNPFNDAATVVTTLLNLPAQASVPALDGRGLVLMAAALTGVAILVLHRK
jgi:hypothetical protein